VGVMGTFTFYYKKGKKEFNCELWSAKQEDVEAVLSKITFFLNGEIYSYLEKNHLNKIDEIVKNIETIQDAKKIKTSDIYSGKAEEKIWYENYFVFKILDKFNYPMFAKIEKKVDYQKTDFNDERVLLICDTDFWTVVKKYAFKKGEDPVISMYAISSIMESIDRKLLELTENKYPSPEIRIRRNFKTLFESLELVPKDNITRGVYVNAVLKSCYNPFISPEMIYKCLPKDKQALLKPPKKAKKKK
jgi:hypothetical protein